MDEGKQRLIDSVIGPTGKFPHGKLNPDDQGETGIAVHADAGNVRVDFGTAVTWFAMPPELARTLATTLTHYADEAEGK